MTLLAKTNAVFRISYTFKQKKRKRRQSVRRNSYSDESSMDEVAKNSDSDAYWRDKISSDEEWKNHRLDFTEFNRE